MTMKKEKKRLKPRIIYVVHGWAYKLDGWQPTVELLKESGLQLEFLKVPGLTQPSKKVWTMDDYTRWLAKELAEVEKPLVLAHSNGGRICLNFCLKQPQKIGRLILLNSAGVPPTVTKNIYLLVVRTLAKVFGFLKKNKTIRRVVYKILRVSDYSQATPNMRQTLGNMLASDAALVPKLMEIQTPVSFIWGQDDKVTPLSEGFFLYENLGNAVSFYLLEEAGHIPYAHHPDALVEAILKIWREYDI